MTSDEPAGDVRSLWQNQTPEIPRPTAEEIRRMVRKMERRMRRARIGFCIALALASAVIVAIAVELRHPLLSAGAAGIVAGFGVLVFEVLHHWRHAPRAENGDEASIEHRRALLEHRLEFHRKRLWLRVVSLAPGGVLFFLGFAAARPDVAPFIYLELATFIVILCCIVPVNRRAAARLERQISQLRTLQSPGQTLPDV